MNFKQSLDRYLTTEPDNGFDSWCEHVIDNFSDEFFTRYEDWIMDDRGECNKQLNILFNGGYAAHTAAAIIETEFKPK